MEDPIELAPVGQDVDVYKRQPGYPLKSMAGAGISVNILSLWKIHRNRRYVMNIPIRTREAFLSHLKILRIHPLTLRGS